MRERWIEERIHCVAVASASHVADPAAVADERRLNSP